MKPASPYLTQQEAADFLRFETVHAFECWRSRRKQAGFPVRAYRRGRKMLFRQVDLEAALEQTVQAPSSGLRVVERS